MIPYPTAPWHDVFTSGAEAAATLNGLLFVAVSLNHERILTQPGLPPAAMRPIGVLLGLLLMSLFILAPGQSALVLGTELTALGALLAGAVMYSAVRTHLPVTQWSWTAQTILLALVSSIPMLVAGITVLAGAGGGLYWALAELVLGFTVAVYYAWVLMVEIAR